MVLLLICSQTGKQNLIMFYMKFTNLYALCGLRGQKSHGEEPSDGVGNLEHKMHQLKKQIQAERMVSVKVSFRIYIYNMHYISDNDERW